MKNSNWKFLRLTCMCAVLVAIWATDSIAYGTFGGGCISCHSDFKANNHNDHIAMASNDCSICHIKNGDDPVIGLNATEDQGCVGCHGRIEDAGNDSLPGGLGAGLRQNHGNSGVASCAACHTDANPSNYTPVGEDVSPPFYSAEGRDPCTDLLDNDGDSTNDGADSDCSQIIETDSDSDGVPDDEDNCPTTPNSGQEDVDSDGDGDVCDTNTIYGTISGAIQAGITVDIYIFNCGGDVDAGSPVTNSEGYYAIGDLLNGRYMIRPQEADYSFASVPNIVDIPQTENQSYDFTVAAPRLLVDNGDGTVTDTSTNLIWLKNADCFGKQNWDTAASSADGLNSGECGLSDGSAAGDWRLPTKVELQGIGTEPVANWPFGSPSVSWTIPSAPFTNVNTYFRWSKSESLVNNNNAWYIRMLDGYSLSGDKAGAVGVWPVRR